jgi:acyl carrier protein
LTTLQRLQAILKKDFDLQPEALVPDARLETLDIDSLRLIEILFSVEDEFKITFPSDQAELKARLQTIGDLVNYIDALVAQRQPAESHGEAAT